MKQRIILGLLVTLMVCSIISCSKNNFEFNENEMTTLGGETLLLQERDDVVYSPDFGFGFVLPESMLNMVKKGTLEIYPASASLTALIVYSEGIFDLIAAFDPNTSTEAEQIAIREEVNKYVFQAGAIARADIEADQEMIITELSQNYAEVDEIAKSDYAVYYYAYNVDYSHLILKDEAEEDLFVDLAQNLKRFEDNIFVFTPPGLVPASEATSGVNYNLSDFKVDTLDGDSVNQTIFEDYDITMVNVWATWCGPCINEMPDLAELHRDMLPENANMITVLTDVPDGVEAAREILASSNAEFDVLFANETLNGFLNTVNAIPTTVMVDSKGNIIGTPIVGAPPSNPAQTYLLAIENALEKVSQ